MIPCSTRVPILAIASASVLYASTARAQDPPAPTVAEGAPARAEPAAPPMQQLPLNVPPLAAPTVRRVDASEPRKITGMVLTAIGIFHGFAGTVTFTTFATMDDGFGALLGLIIGGPMLGEGLILSSIGIPLWVSGARTVETIDQPLTELIPSLDLGPGTATATWQF